MRDAGLHDKRSRSGQFSENPVYRQRACFEEESGSFPDQVPMLMVRLNAVGAVGADGLASAQNTGQIR